MHSRILLLLLPLALIIAPASPRAANEASRPATCPVPEEFTTPDEPLAQLSVAVTTGTEVNILAVGSATTVGATAGGAPGTSFPEQMVEALRAAMPRVTFNLTVRGGRGMTAEAMLPLVTTALATQHYHLVMWQTGTVEAVRGLRPDGMQEALQEGVDRVHAGGGDVVLIDAQFSRFLRANTDLEPYEAVLQQVATMPGVVLFNRFELMRFWANEGQIDLERTPKPDRERAMARLSSCLGDALARFVLNGALPNGTASNGRAAPPR